MRDNEKERSEKAAVAKDDPVEAIDEGRREAIRKVGKAAWVAPAVVAVVMAEKAYAAPQPAPPAPPT